MKDCIFCDFRSDDRGARSFENELCYSIAQECDLLDGWYMIVPKAHRETPFDLSIDEWVATKELLRVVKNHLDAKFNPDGYNINWNVGKTAGQTIGHCHLHIIPRFSDEPFAGKGIRQYIASKENKRPSKC